MLLKVTRPSQRKRSLTRQKIEQSRGPCNDTSGQSMDRNGEEEEYVRDVENSWIWSESRNRDLESCWSAVNETQHMDVSTSID